MRPDRAALGRAFFSLPLRLAEHEFQRANLHCGSARGNADDDVARHRRLSRKRYCTERPTLLFATLLKELETGRLSHLPAGRIVEDHAQLARACYTRVVFDRGAESEALLANPEHSALELLELGELERGLHHDLFNQWEALHLPVDPDLAGKFQDKGDGPVAPGLRISAHIHVEDEGLPLLWPKVKESRGSRGRLEGTRGACYPHPVGRPEQYPHFHLRPQGHPRLTHHQGRLQSACLPRQLGLGAGRLLHDGINPRGI